MVEHDFSPAVVALLAEGVDRNDLDQRERKPQQTVALLAEGVDRNIYKGDGLVCIAESPSSRRAWIEITLPQC